MIRTGLRRPPISSGCTIRRTIESLALDFKDGEGLLHRLLTDEEYAQSLSEDLEVLLDNLRRVSGQIAEGEGSLGQLIRDPHLYQAIDDVIVGVDESRLLRWLVRNRQQAGIKKRHEEEEAAQEQHAQPVGAANAGAEEEN